jgi:predicted membrane protein
MVKRSKTVPERILTVLGLTLAAGWSAFWLWAILQFDGGSTVSTWVARLIMAAVAAAVTVGVALVVRSIWRQAVARPLPRGRVNAWLVRQSWWRLALINWAGMGGSTVAGTFYAANMHHGAPSGAYLIRLALGTGIYSAFLALNQYVLWRRQAENTVAKAGD